VTCVTEICNCVAVSGERVSGKHRTKAKSCMHGPDDSIGRWLSRAETLAGGYREADLHNELCTVHRVTTFSADIMQRAEYVFFFFGGGGSNVDVNGLFLWASLIFLQL
jgi:hypothetical protein